MSSMKILNPKHPELASTERSTNTRATAPSYINEITDYDSSFGQVKELTLNITHAYITIIIFMLRTSVILYLILNECNRNIFRESFGWKSQIIFMSYYICII